jgi:hypothetical protein
LQVDEPLTIGQPTSFFGAVMSEQAVRTTEAMMATAVKRRLRFICDLLTRGKAGRGTEARHNVSPSADQEMPFSYQKMPVSYQKHHFSYHLHSR